MSSAKLSEVAVDEANVSKSIALFQRLKFVNEEFDDDGQVLKYNPSQLNENLMMSHIIDCLSALRIIQKQLDHTRSHLSSQVDQDDETRTNILRFKRRLFDDALSLVIHSKDQDAFTNSNPDVNVMLKLFPSELSSNPTHISMFDDNSWLPLHWAVVLGNGDDLNDIKRLCISDPWSFRLQSSSSNRNLGINAVHLACMKSSPDIELINFFVALDPTIFHTPIINLPDGDSRLHFTALHFAALYSENSYIIWKVNQADRSVAIMAGDNDVEASPMALFSQRQDFPLFKEILTTILEIDNRPKVSMSTIQILISKSIESSEKYTKLKFKKLFEPDEGNNHHVDTVIYSDVNPLFPLLPTQRYYDVIQMILDLNPACVRYRNDGQYLLHSILNHNLGKLSATLSYQVTEMILTIDKNAATDIDDNGCLPVHYAASKHDVNVIRLLINAYSESVDVLTPKNRNLLHQASFDEWSVTDIIEEKIKYLCEICPPDYLRQHDTCGSTPLHIALDCINLRYRVVAVICHFNSEVVKDRMICVDTG